MIKLPQKVRTAKSLQPLRSLVPFIAPYKGILAIAIAALLVSSAALLAMPIAVRNVIDQGFSVEDAANVDRYFYFAVIRPHHRIFRCDASLSRELARGKSGR